MRRSVLDASPRAKAFRETLGQMKITNFRRFPSLSRLLIIKQIETKKRITKFIGTLKRDFRMRPSNRRKASRL